MVFSSIVETFREITSWVKKFIDWSPKPLKILMFLFLIVGLAGGITGFFMNFFYTCDLEGNVYSFTGLQTSVDVYITDFTGQGVKLSNVSNPCGDNLSESLPIDGSIFIGEYCPSVREFYNLSFWQSAEPYSIVLVDNLFFADVEGYCNGDCNSTGWCEQVSTFGSYECSDPFGGGSVLLSESQSDALEGGGLVSYSREEGDIFLVACDASRDPQLTVNGVNIFSYRLWLVLIIFGAFVMMLIRLKQVGG